LQTHLGLQRFPPLSYHPRYRYQDTNRLTFQQSIHAESSLGGEKMVAAPSLTSGTRSTS
jgi:hypothetical protein